MSPPNISPAGPLVAMTGLEPGDQRSTSFRIGNPNQADTVAKILAELTGGDRQLYDRLVVELSSSDGVFWRGPVSALLDPTSALTRIASGTQRDITLTLSVPSDLDDSYQGRISQFSLKFALDHAVPQSADGVAPAARLGHTRPSYRAMRRSNFYTRLRRKAKRRQLILFFGRATDEGSGVARVDVSVMRVVDLRRGEQDCRSWSPVKNRYVRRSSKRLSCRKPLWYAASGKERFSFVLFGKMIRRGRYIVRVRAIDNAANTQSKFSRRKSSVRRFRIR
ncbi:MAG: hypothetical protein WAP35_05225 [Solirubrobacterales bacterium]